jgi:hypothetical protein
MPGDDNSFLEVLPKEYLPLNEAAHSMFNNIMGMMVSRNKCTTVAQELLRLNLMDAPELASFGGSRHDSENRGGRGQENAGGPCGNFGADGIR